MDKQNMIAGLYVCHSSAEEMEKIIQIMLEEGLIACANIFPIKSQYPWKGEIVADDELVSLLKTSLSRADECIARLEEIHPYEVPCILQYEIKANPSYYAWIESITASISE